MLCHVAKFSLPPPHTITLMSVPRSPTCTTGRGTVPSKHDQRLVCTIWESLLHLRLAAMNPQLCPLYSTQRRLRIATGWRADPAATVKPCRTPLLALHLLVNSFPSMLPAPVPRVPHRCLPRRRRRHPPLLGRLQQVRYTTCSLALQKQLPPRSLTGKQTPGTVARRVVKAHGARQQGRFRSIQSPNPPKAIQVPTCLLRTRSSCPFSRFSRFRPLQAWATCFLPCPRRTCSAI